MRGDSNPQSKKISLLARTVPNMLHVPGGIYFGPRRLIGVMS